MATLEFKDIHYSINSLHILKGVSGKVEGGRFCAFLGRSGSGKTTLLDVLAKRKQEGEWNGSILFNGKPVTNQGEWRRRCGYVLQHDRLLSSATVFETLMFSVQLRTKYGTPYQEHKRKVETVLEELGLSHRKDARVGSETARSLSGGETRRVSIGVELVADVQVLLLDEPTSGLDSTTARSIVEVLKELAKNKTRIVAATIHQPSSSITALFDDMMLLSDGRMCYSGPFSQVVPHFAALGFECPMYTNPTDFLMDLSAEPESAAVMVRNVKKRMELPSSTAMIDASDAEIEDEDDDQETERNQARWDREAGSSLTPFWFQFRVIWLRNFRQWYRNELMLYSELIQYIFCGLFIGIMYHSFEDDLDGTTGVFDRISAVFFILTTICFIPSFTVVTLYGEERPLFKKEAASAMYRPSASFLAKIFTTWPFELFLGLIFSACCYFLSGFQIGFEQFAVFFLVVAIFQLLSETIGLMCAISTPTPTIGVLILSIVLLICLALGGFLVSEPKAYYEWFENINFFVFAYTAMTLNEFSGLSLDVGGMQVDGVEYLRQIGRLRNDLTKWENIAVLFGMLIIIRGIAFLLMLRQIKASSFKKSKTVPTDTERLAQVKVDEQPSATV